MNFLIGYSGIIVSIILILLINRHVIGLPGYGFFYPLIIGCIMASPLVAHERVWIAIIATIIGWIVHNVIKEEVHLLIYPKHALYVIISLIVFLCMSIVYSKVLYNDTLSREQINMIVLSFVIVVSSMPKIYNEGKGPQSFIRWIHIGYFLLLSGIINILINSDKLIYFFSLYRPVSIALALITISLGFYTGLQVKEIIRFRKLIWTRITSKKSRVKSNI